ncbi:MAG: sialate O-acetylesterase [Pirellulales bacterium]
MNAVQNPCPRLALTVLVSVLLFGVPTKAEDNKTVRIFIFAGQSNMVGSDSKVKDIRQYPPFAGLEDAQGDVKFSYCIGRENKLRSNGWVDLQPVNQVVGPELSFARRVARHIDAPIAIIKCAAGGTHLGGDWNPDEPIGFKMYPLALDLIKASLADLDKRKIRYRIEGFMWHQGENDMFNEGYMAAYGKNLANFLARWRRDLKTPNLKFYIGELCTKTIWGMDLRPRMYAISLGQRAVTDADPQAEYIPTAQVGVEIGRPVGLHYHYGTLGQLQHGENYATAYLRTNGVDLSQPRPLKTWPYKKGGKVKLFVLAGHRNMEGERAFEQELAVLKSATPLLRDNFKIAYKYNLGGGYKVSNGWEPLGLTGYYDTFGPELSFAQTLQGKVSGAIAIAKFTHSGSQIIDWTPAGSMAKSRHVYPKFIGFVKEAVQQLKSKGQEVELTGIFYHLGENDMSFHPYRKQAAERLKAIIAQSREDLQRPALKWYVSQQPPTDDKRLNDIDVVANVAAAAAADPGLAHLKVFDLPKQEKKLVIDTAGIVRLGELLAEGFLRAASP